MKAILPNLPPQLGKGQQRLRRIWPENKSVLPRFEGELHANALLVMLGQSKPHSGHRSQTSKRLGCTCKRCLNTQRPPGTVHRKYIDLLAPDLPFCQAPIQAVPSLKLHGRWIRSIWEGHPPCNEGSCNHRPKWVETALQQWATLWRRALQCQQCSTQGVCMRALTAWSPDLRWGSPWPRALHLSLLAMIQRVLASSLRLALVRWASNVSCYWRVTDDVTVRSCGRACRALTSLSSLTPTARLGRHAINTRRHGVAVPEVRDSAPASIVAGDRCLGWRYLSSSAVLWSMPALLARPGPSRLVQSRQGASMGAEGGCWACQLGRRPMVLSVTCRTSNADR